MGKITKFYKKYEHHNNISESDGSSDNEHISIDDMNKFLLKSNLKTDSEIIYCKSFLKCEGKNSKLKRKNMSKNDENSDGIYPNNKSKTKSTACIENNYEKSKKNIKTRVNDLIPNVVIKKEKETDYEVVEHPLKKRKIKTQKCTDYQQENSGAIHAKQSIIKVEQDSFRSPSQLSNLPFPIKKEVVTEDELDTVSPKIKKIKMYEVTDLKIEKSNKCSAKCITTNIQSSPKIIQEVDMNCSERRKSKPKINLCDVETGISQALDTSPKLSEENKINEEPKYLPEKQSCIKEKENLERKAEEAYESSTKIKHNVNERVKNSNKPKNQEDVIQSKKKPFETIEDEFVIDDDIVRDDYFFELLASANIIISWEVPELHKIFNDVSRHPKPEVRKKILAANLPWRQGRFSTMEEKKIKQSWKRLCAMYNLPDCPEVFARWRNTKNNKKFEKARRKAVLFLAQRLPNRTLVQVYQNFLHGLGAPTKGRFTEKEKDIVELFRTDKEYEGLTQRFLGGVLGRDCSSIWRYITDCRMKEKSKTPKPKVKWTLELCETFINKLLRIVNDKIDPPNKSSTDVEILKGKISKDVWKKLGEEMGLTGRQVKVFWLSKLSVQLFVTEPIYLTAIRIKLVNILQTKDFTDWVDVNWKDVAAEFPNYTSLFLWKKFYDLAKCFCPGTMFGNFSELVKNIHQRFIVDMSPTVNKHLRRLTLDVHGKLHFKS